MEAIIRHSPITCNGPIYNIYGNSPYQFGVNSTWCAKGSKAKSTAAHVDPEHRGSRGFCLPVFAACHEHLRFLICTWEKRDCLSFPAVFLTRTVATLCNSSSKSLCCEAA